ncbi:hypothetical protein FE784_30935 [Paenibacillus hemerocallicola]|uniref:Uncharacterized protein n=1 Tax=Paenibacillus hemerocallicola TaxID=1172614 RepID=A0A5C4T2L9_9BACL|nr:hypothetical protein [Paenibacillus hemerocallicola]TNJ62389.1 hypothetical protein FE784_30935 [Paenibacillus hemerocallicola]
MAPPKPYKSRILGGPSKTAGVQADVRVADKGMAGNDPDRFASGIMSKYGFTRGNYLGRLSLVFKQQRELVRQIMRGAKSSDVMTAQWLIRLQQLQQAMPATPRERMVVSETTRLVERIIVEKETAQTGNGQSADKSALIPDSKPTGHASEERSDAPNTGRSGRSGDEKTDRSERSRDKQAKTTKTRNSRKSSDPDGTTPASPDGKSKRKRKANQEAVNKDTKAADPATEIAPPIRAEVPGGKGVVIIRAKPFADGSMFTQLEAAGPKHGLGMRTGLGVKSAMVHLAGRRQTDGNPGSRRARNEQPGRLGAKSVYLHPFETIYRSTRTNTYAESVIDKYARASDPASRNTLTRNDSVQLRGTPRLDRNSLQAKQANREHNEGYSAETVRPMDRDSGHPAVESLFPSNRAADSIRLPYKLPAQAKIGAAPVERKHTSLKPFPLSGNNSAVAAVDGHSPGHTVQRLLRKPIGGRSINPAIDRDFSSSLGNMHVFRRPLQGNGHSIPGARAIRHAIVFARPETVDPYIMINRFAFRRSPLHGNQAVRPNTHGPFIARKSERLNSQAWSFGRPGSSDQVVGAGPARRGVQTFDHFYGVSAGSRVRPVGGQLTLLMHRHDKKGKETVHRRTMHPSHVSYDANGRQPVFSKGVLSNSTQSSIPRFLSMRIDTAFRPMASTLRSRLDTPAVRAFDDLLTDISTDNRLFAAMLSSAGHTNALSRQSGNQSSDAIIRRKQRFEKEEDDKPFRTVHRFGNERERGTASMPGRVPTGRRLTGRTIIPSAESDDSGMANTASPFAIGRGSTAGFIRAPSMETIVARARRAVTANERETSILPSSMALRREVGIRRNLLDPTAMPEKNAWQMSLFSRDLRIHRERGGSLRSIGDKPPTVRNRHIRNDDVSSDFVEDGAIQANRSQPRQNERGKRSAVFRSTIHSSTQSPIGFSSGQYTAIRQFPYGIGASEFTPPTSRQLRRMMSAAAYPTIKRNSRHPEPRHRFDRLAGTQSEDAVYSPRASAAASLVSRLVLRRSSADHAESDAPSRIGFSFGQSTAIRQFPYGTGVSEFAPPTSRQLRRMISNAAYPTIKRISRHPEPRHRFDRLAGTQSEDAVYSPRASAAASLVSRLVLRQSSADHAESDGGISYGPRSPVRGKPYTEETFQKYATSRMGHDSGIGPRSGPYEEDKKAFVFGIKLRPAMTSISGGISADHADNAEDFPSARRPIRLKRTAAPGTPMGHIRDPLSVESFGRRFPLRIQAARPRHVNSSGSSPEPTSVIRMFVQRSDRGEPGQARMLRMPSKSGIIPSAMPVGSISRPQADRMRLIYGNYDGTYGLADLRNTLRKYALDAGSGVGSTRAFTQAVPNRLAVGRSISAASAIDRLNVRLNPAKPQTIRTIEDRFMPMSSADKASDRTGSGPSYPATIGLMLKRLLRGRQDPEAGPFGMERGAQSDKSGTVRMRPLYGSGVADGARSYSGLQSVRQNGVIHRRNGYGASAASSYGQNAKMFRAAADISGATDRSRNGFPSTESGAVRHRPALFSSASDRRRSSVRASLSFLLKRHAEIETDVSESWPELSTGTIRRQSGELNVLTNRMPTSAWIPAVDDPNAEFAISRSDVSNILSHSRKQTSSRRDGPDAFVNRLSAYGDSGSGNAVERMIPIRRRYVPTANGSDLSAGKDGLTPFVVGADSHRRPSRGAQQDLERWTRPGSDRTLLRYRSHFTDRTDRIHTAVSFQSGIAREHASAARSSGEIRRTAPLKRNETARAAPVSSARSVGMTGEKLVFPYRSREAAADGMERIQRRWSGSNANVRTSIVRNVNRFTSSPGIIRSAAPIVSLYTLDRAAGENGGGFAIVQRAPGPISGTANSAVRTIRDGYQAWYNYYFAKTGTARMESPEKRPPDRIRPSAAAELRLVRTAMNPGAAAAGTLRMNKSGGRSPVRSERRGIPQQQTAISAASENVLRMRQSDTRHTDPMFQLEHKLKAAVPGALGSDPADLDYRRQMKPAAPPEQAPAAEPVPPQVDMAELQEMVKKLPQFDIKKIVDRVYREIERKIRFDRQTRGL